MSLLNLSLAQFLVLAFAVGAFVVALYLLDRARRRQVVSTLRFYTVAERISKPRRLLRIQEPWSLLLQLFSILLLLAASAGLQWGTGREASRDHVILLDTSAWMGARGRAGTLLDEAKNAAAAYVRALPPSERVMIVRTDAIATPVTRFETDRTVLQQAIRSTRAGAAGLRLDTALQFARQALQQEGHVGGAVVYAGAGRISGEDAAVINSGARLRVLPVSEPADNCGIRRLSVRRSENDSTLWEIFVAVRNYGRRPCDAPLTIEFGRALIGSRRFLVAAGQELSTTFGYRTRAAGWIDARLRINDSLAQDNHAQIEIPAQPPVRVLVYSDQPALLKPILAANANFEAVFAQTGTYDPKTAARVVVFDRFRPPVLPAADIIWIEPPTGSSPFTIRETLRDVRLERWHGEHPLGAGLRTRDLRLETAQVFSAAPGDIPVADCSAGPIILARPGEHKSVAIGFHPGQAATRFELATPLLFANLLRWMAPEVFRQWEVTSGSVGLVTASVDPLVDPARIKVVDDGGRALPFTAANGSLQFFTSVPGAVQVSEGNRTSVFSLALPEVAESRWEPPQGTPRGLPAAGTWQQPPTETWRWLALAGILGLFVEWMWFGPRRATRSRSPR